MDRKEKIASLEPASLQFYNQLKWFRGNIAKNYVHPLQRAAFLDNIDLASKKLKISDFKIIRITLAEKGKKAVIRLRISWHHKNEGIVHETLIEDKWKLEGDNWYKYSSERKDGKEIPYVLQTYKKKSEKKSEKSESSPSE
ncbi:MAG: hypothetical protein ACQES9_03405 [Myxococcota bacterium]